MPVSSQESERSCIYVLWVSIVTLFLHCDTVSTICLLDFGNILTVWYFSFFMKQTVQIGHERYIYNTCALSKHIGNMCMRLRNRGKGEALPSLFPRFVPNTHIYLYASDSAHVLYLSCNFKS